MDHDDPTVTHTGLCNKKMIVADAWSCLHCVSLTMVVKSRSRFCIWADQSQQACLFALHSDKSHLWLAYIVDGTVKWQAESQLSPDFSHSQC